MHSNDLMGGGGADVLNRLFAKNKRVLLNDLEKKVCKNTLGRGRKFL